MTPLDPRIYYAIFETHPDGKKVLEELCRVFYDKPSYVRGDTHETAFNEGAKSVINLVLQKIALSQQQPTGDTDND